MSDKPPHIVLIRLSALGDIAISAPLIREYAIKNPDVRFTMVSQAFVEPLFLGISNLHFFPINIKRDGNIKGLYKVAQQIARLKPTYVADLHSVIRSKILSGFLFLRAVPSVSINKNRKARKELLNHKDTDTIKPLEQVQRLYENVLVKCGLDDLGFASKNSKEDLNNREFRAFIKSARYDYLIKLCSDNGEVKNEQLAEYINMSGYKIGIAPFAKHAGKRWPQNLVEDLIFNLSRDNSNKIYLFGGGIDEEKILMGWEQKYQNTIQVAGKFSFAEELLLMNNLDVMVSMDSANMHLASFAGTPVISVWGATDPSAGFYGWKQNMGNVVHADFACRPCSIYGNKPCKFGDYRCLRSVTPDMVENKILNLRGEKNNE